MKTADRIAEALKQTRIAREDGTLTEPVRRDLIDIELTLRLIEWELRVRRGPPLTDGGQTAGPRKWAHGDENPVMCQHCGSTWAGNSLYKTGDVLRCPGCDGVMRP